MASVAEIPGFKKEVRPKLVLDRKVVLVDVSRAATQILIAGYSAWHLVWRREEFIQEYLGCRVTGDERCVDEVR
jgi:hypothetical protein